MSAFVMYLAREALNKHGLEAQQVKTNFTEVLMEGRDPQLLLEVAQRIVPPGMRAVSARIACSEKPAQFRQTPGSARRAVAPARVVRLDGFDRECEHPR